MRLQILFLLLTTVALTSLVYGQLIPGFGTRHGDGQRPLFLGFPRHFAEDATEDHGHNIPEGKEDESDETPPKLNGVNFFGDKHLLKDFRSSSNLVNLFETVNNFLKSKRQQIAPSSSSFDSEKPNSAIAESAKNSSNLNSATKNDTGNAFPKEKLSTILWNHPLFGIFQNNPLRVRINVRKLKPDDDQLHSESHEPDARSKVQTTLLKKLFTKFGNLFQGNSPVEGLEVVVPTPSTNIGPNGSLFKRMLCRFTSLFKKSNSTQAGPETVTAPPTSIQNPMIKFYYLIVHRSSNDQRTTNVNTYNVLSEDEEKLEPGKGKGGAATKESVKSNGSGTSRTLDAPPYIAVSFTLLCFLLNLYRYL